MTQQMLWIYLQSLLRVFLHSNKTLAKSKTLVYIYKYNSSGNVNSTFYSHICCSHLVIFSPHILFQDALPHLFSRIFTQTNLLTLLLLQLHQTVSLRFKLCAESHSNLTARKLLTSTVRFIPLFLHLSVCLYRPALCDVLLMLKTEIEYQIRVFIRCIACIFWNVWRAHSITMMSEVDNHECEAMSLEEHSIIEPNHNIILNK